MEPVKPATEPEPELDPRELKALSRQERKEAKAALRREQQEARNAARQAKAAAKVADRLGAAATAAAAPASDVAAGEDVVEISDDVEETPVSDVADGETDAEAEESVETTPEATDPRARAAQRVQRRLGKDAEKLSAAEARARARDEARRRRAQAKEQSSGVVAEEAVRPPAEPTEAEQTIEAEPFVDEVVAAIPVVEEESVVDDAVEEAEPDLPKPVIAEEPVVVDEPEPATEWEPAGTSRWRGSVESRETTEPEPEPKPKRRPSLAPIAGIVGLIALGVSVLLAVGALLVALGFDSGGLYEGLKTVANLLVGPLEGAFDFSGANAERKEHFLAWGAGSIGYLLISFVGQAVQRANDDN
jgi:hypothetical protein